MSFIHMFDRRLLWGIAAAAAVMLTVLALSAVLISSAVLPESVGGPAVCIAYFSGAAIGGRVSMGGKRAPAKSLLCAACFTALILLSALLSPGTLTPDIHALTVLLCTLCGAVCADLPGFHAKKKRPAHQRRRGGRHP